MNVHELIALLQKLPQHYDVRVYNAGDEPICYANIDVLIDSETAIICEKEPA